MDSRRVSGRKEEKIWELRFFKDLTYMDVKAPQNRKDRKESNLYNRRLGLEYDSVTQLLHGLGGFIW